MSSYVIIEFNVLDPEKMQQYGELAAPTVSLFGGSFVAKGAAQALHGELLFTNKAVIEFTDEQQAIDWYNSPEYQALIELRDKAMNSQFHLVLK